MSDSSTRSSFVPRVVMLCGLAGIMTGLVISSMNEDSLGWSLLRTAVLGVVFAMAARHLLYQSLRAWLETKMDVIEKQAKEKIAEAAKGQAAKPSVQRGI